MQNRHLILGIALIATLVAAYQLSQQPASEVIETITQHTQPHNSVKSAANIDPNALANKSDRYWALQAEIRDIFYVKPLIVDTPVLIAPPPVIVAEPPQLVAPPLPFVYLGKMTSEGRSIVYVAKADRNYALKGGEMIDGQYSVQSVDSQKIIFNYIPLNTQQILNTGGSN